jgi:glycerol-3-phosphate acyltransferase PlsY
MITRLICLIAGYLFGLLETGFIYGKLHGIDIRQYGSGNSGTTNALRVLGKKAGLVVFLGDFLKAFLPCLICRLLLQSTYPDTILVYVLYVGLGVVLGHNFPFYMHFKGGKGIAATAGTIVGLLNPIMIISLLVLFIITVAITRYVSVGSILLMLEFAVFYIVLAVNGKLCFQPELSASRNGMIESIVLVIIFAALAIYKHKANIIRLLHGTENKLGQKKVEE